MASMAQRTSIVLVAVAAALLLNIEPTLSESTEGPTTNTTEAATGPEQTNTTVNTDHQTQTLPESTEDQTTDTLATTGPAQTNATVSEGPTTTTTTGPTTTSITTTSTGG